MGGIQVDISQGIATITLNRPATYNAITAEDYDTLGEALREIDTKDDVVVTILQAKGKFFCAGTDVKVDTNAKAPSIRQAYLQRVSPSVTDCNRALYSHSKLLVAALNGPALGIAAAFLGHFDFICGLPSAWIAVPFSSLGLIAEAGSSITFASRLGLSRANEILILGKKAEASDLLRWGFYNRIFPQQSVEEFHRTVRKHVLEQIDGLDPAAMLKTKALIQHGLNEQNSRDGANMRESFAQAARIASGEPQVRFGRVARKEVKHKL